MPRLLLTKQIPRMGAPRVLRRFISLLACCISFALLFTPFGTTEHVQRISEALYTPGYLDQTFGRAWTVTHAHALARAHQHTFLHREEHMYLDTGLLEVNPGARHPIYDLIKGGEHEWEHKMQRQSRTLRQAVSEYRRRYGRLPPRGFDTWWMYVERHRVQLPDEYDQIMNDLERFWAYTPADLRQLQNATRTLAGSWSLASNTSLQDITLSGLNASESETQGALQKAAAQMELIHGFDERWRDQEGQWTTVAREVVRATGDWEMTFALDGPVQLNHWEVNDKMLHAAEYGEYIDAFDTPDKPESSRQGWAAACPPYSPLREEYPRRPKLPLPDPVPKTFIYSQHKLLDPCTHPELVHISGFFASRRTAAHGGPGERGVVFAHTKSVLHGDVLAPSMEGWVEGPVGDSTWAEKDDGRVFWRGAPNDIVHNASTPWAQSHRSRLVSTLNEQKRARAVLPPAQSKTGAVGEPLERDTSVLNSAFADVAFTGQPVECEPEECEKMGKVFRWEAGGGDGLPSKHKYVLDVDGDTGSPAFKRLMSSQSVLLKATVFPEWYTDRIMPWVHYVPLKLDYTDLYDILTFFRGDVGSLAGTGRAANEHLAEKIARAGSEWSEAFYRRQDMVAYMWRLLLEYGRLMSDARDDMGFVL